MEKKKVVSFQDLDVYQRTYKASIRVMKEVVPKLPDREKYDLCDQLSRSCKAIPRLIAEGYGKRHQKKGFQKYLDDAMGESNEIIVSLSHTKDLYNDCVEESTCSELIEMYDISGRQIYKLRKSWSSFKELK